MSNKKHKSCHQYEGPVIQVVIVEPFHRPSALLHLFGWEIGRGADGHLWVVNAHCVLPDLCIKEITEYLRKCLNCSKLM